MAGRITIRGGVVFVASDAVLKDVSIFDAQVICPTSKGDAESLNAALLDRAVRNVTINDCTLVPHTLYAVRQFRSAVAKAEIDAGPQEADAPSWIRKAMSLLKKGGA